MSLPIGSLAMAVSLPAGFTPLITTAGGALLPSPSCRTTFPAAIALTTVTAAAHKEQGATARPVADPWEKRRLDHHRLDFGAHLITITWIPDDRTDDRASGADDVAGALYSGERLRKLRFLMTDNTQQATAASSWRTISSGHA